MPLDPRYPLARIADMLEDSQASLMLTNHRNLPLARELAADRLLSVLNLDELESSVAMMTWVFRFLRIHLPIFCIPPARPGIPREFITVTEASYTTLVTVPMPSTLAPTIA